jgi:hypothetical protein
MNPTTLNHTLFIDERGTVRALGNPLDLPGAGKSFRYSEIVPVNRFLRGCFRMLRFLFGEKGRVSEFTRRWPCHWQATILHSGQSARCASRLQLIEWEHMMFAEDHHTPAADL